MNIQTITLSELPDFLTSTTFQQSAVLPITTHRALSHLHNPRAKADDVVLLMALENSEIVGYIGLLPDELFYENEIIRVAWLSCWWVQEGTGNLGITLFLKAYQIWQRRMVITDFTPHIKTMIEKMRLFHFAPTSYGVRGFMRFNTAEVLPPKKPIFKILQPLLKIGDTVANILNIGRLQLWKWRQPKATFQIKKINRIDKNTALFIQKHQQNELFKRGAAELNWILDYPWVLENSSKLSNTIQNEAQRYYFSTLSPTFQYEPLQIYKNHQFIGFLLLLNRDRHFKLPYIYVETPHLPMVMQALFHFLVKNKAITFTVFQPEITSFLGHYPNPFFYQRQLPKDFAIGKNLDKSILEKGELQGGDGDYGFT